MTKRRRSRQDGFKTQTSHRDSNEASSIMVLVLIVFLVFVFLYYIKDTKANDSSVDSSASMDSGSTSMKSETTAMDSGSTSMNSGTSMDSTSTDEGDLEETITDGEAVVDTSSDEELRGSRIENASGIKGAQAKLADASRILKSEKSSGQKTAKNRLDDAARILKSEKAGGMQSAKTKLQDASRLLRSEQLVSKFERFRSKKTNLLNSGQFQMKAYASRPILSKPETIPEDWIHNTTVKLTPAMSAFDSNGDHLFVGDDSRTVESRNKLGKTPFEGDIHKLKRDEFLHGIEKGQAMELTTDHSFTPENYQFASGSPVTEEDFANQAKDWEAKKASIKPVVDDTFKSFAKMLKDMFPKMNVIKNADNTGVLLKPNKRGDECIDLDNYEQFVNWTVSQQLGGKLEVPAFIRNSKTIDLKAIEASDLSTLKSNLLINCNDGQGYRINKDTGIVFSRSKRADIQFEYLWPKDQSLVASRPFKIKMK